MPDKKDITQILQMISSGNRDAAAELMPLVYDEFRKSAARFMQKEPSGHTLQATALVHEAYLKLVDQSRVDWRGRTHFYAVGAQAMRRILVDHAKKKKARKRGSGLKPLLFDDQLSVSPHQYEELISLDRALKKLAETDERQARIVELRFFGGLTAKEAAEVMNLSKRTVDEDWRMARAWLRRELKG